MLADFYSLRLSMYNKRKLHLSEMLTQANPTPTPTPTPAPNPSPAPNPNPNPNAGLVQA